MSDHRAALRTVRANGLTLAYRVLGDPAAPPMVLLHGLGASGADWDGVAGRLAADHRVYAVDMRGHGESDWPGSYGFPDYAADTAAFITALGLAPVTLVGHSLGGLAAQLLAVRHPELLHRLVLEETPALVPADPPQEVPERPESPGFDWEVKIQTVRQRNAPDPRWYADSAGIAVPTLLLHGGPSSFLPEEPFKDLAARMADCRLVTIGDAGHLVHLNRPDEFTGAVREFLPAAPST